jgi:hypothetical protein
VFHRIIIQPAPALTLLLACGLPHLSEAINAVGVAPTPMHASGKLAGVGATPLHLACENARWDAALALLVAGARVDIAGGIDGRVQTIAEWDRNDLACKHRGVKLAIAARAREHAAQAAAVAKGLPSGGAESVAGSASAAAPARGTATAHTGSARSAIGAAVVSLTAPAADRGVFHARASASAAVAATPSAGGQSKLATARKGKGARGARAKNRAEESTPCDEEDALSRDCIASQAAAPAAAETICSAVRSSCEESKLAAANLDNLDNNNLAEARSASNPPEDRSVAAGCAAAATWIAVPVQASPHCETAGLVATAGGPSAATTNICEPGEEAPETSNTCESGEEARATSNTCEPCQEAPATSNICEPGEVAPATSNTCESGEEARATSNTCEPCQEAPATSNICEPGQVAPATSNTCEPGEEAPATSNTCEPGEEARVPGNSTCEEGEGAASAEAGFRHRGWYKHAGTDR